MSLSVRGESSPSLDLGKNNSNKPSESKDGAEKERYDCRRVYSDFFHEEEETGARAEFRCNQWDCYCCGYRMRQNLVEEINRLVQERPEMRRLMTLTLDPKKVPDDVDAHQHLTETWNKFRTYIQREYGDFSFVWVREEQESGNPHLHVLVSRYLPQAWISNSWSTLGGGEIVDIRRVDRVEKVGHYLGKYLTKDALTGLPRGIQRYNSSSDIHLDVRGSKDSDGDWTLKVDDKLRGEERPVYDVDFVFYRMWGGCKPPPFISKETT